MVPLCDFGVCEKSVVPAGEAGLSSLGGIVVERQVRAERVIGVLPIAILRLVDRLDRIRRRACSAIVLCYLQTTLPPNDRSVV